MIHHLDNEEGLLTLDVGGQKRTLKFGMKCSKIIGEKLNEIKDTVSGFDQVTVFLWGGLLSKPLENNLPEGFDLATAFEWMDDLPKKETELIVALGIECMGFISRYTQMFQDSAYRKGILSKEPLVMNGKK
jgi:hypothetical protein